MVTEAVLVYRYEENARPADIVGFHMTSLKFKLQNYWFYWDFTFMVY